MTRPILAISEVARGVVQQRDYSKRAPHFSDDEVGALADAFNDMLSQIEHRTQELEVSMREQAREVSERRVAQQEVMRLNQELERRVDDRTAQLVASNDDLTRATATAQNANRAKSEFLSSMSHELRTPLNAIIGFGQLLEAPAVSITPEKRRLFTGHIVKAGHHLLTLINDILQLAQIESGKLALSLESVRVADVLADCRLMTESLGAGRGIRVVFPVPCELRVVADQTRLKQVLLNLLSNAIKYNRDDGTVHVECTLCEPAGPPQGRTAERAARSDPDIPGRVRFSVRDSGLGLRPEQLESLFQPFNRLGQELGAEQGTGIGLVVAKRMVESMAGRIGVDSTPGIGSVFWVEFNAAVALAAAPKTLPVPAPAGGTEPGADASIATVLCVDDNPASLALVQEILGRRSDLRLLSAADGRAAVAMARAQHPQIILMDNNMPHLTGIEAQAILRDDPECADILVIALTANAMPDAMAQGLAAGFFRYLTKPIDVAELFEAIDAALALARMRERP